LNYDSNIEKNQNFKATENTTFVPDIAGWFKVHVDREKNEIIAVHYPTSADNPGTIIRGRTPHEVYQTIIRLNLVSKLEHAAYLGRELESAYLALRTGRSYLQDNKLF
jgi:dihydropteroate synthase